MRALFQKYRGVIRFLLVFIGSYVVLSLLYGAFLQWDTNRSNPADSITQKVAQQSEELLREWGYDAQVHPIATYPGVQLLMDGKAVGQIVEGCNSVSIILLFIAFVVAFAQGWKKTFFFLFAGAILIYAVNLIRIAILAIALHHYPEHQEILHRVVFPGIIYGMVFLLWVIWARSMHKANPDE